MSKEVVVIIDHETGKVDLDLKGFQGQGCGDLSQKLARALGQKTSEEYKPEYYDSQSNSVTAGCQ